MMRTGADAPGRRRGRGRAATSSSHRCRRTGAPPSRRAPTELAREGVARIDAVRRRREELVAEQGEAVKPYVYVIVATGNIHEDAVQAQAAARAGADVVAVIRTTAQSLLDYVPYGVTTEGFGGTYATQENFRLHARGARRGRRRARPLHPPRATTARACACPRSPRWAPSSGST